MQNNAKRTMKPAVVQVYGTFLGITLGKAGSGSDAQQQGKLVAIPSTT